jgi:hypothetical protein
VNTHRLAAAVVVVVVATAVLLVGIASAKNFSAWAPAQKIDEIGGNSAELNTAALDGCPIQSPDGLSLYMASNRPGGHGLLDIWVAHRSSVDEPWGAPVNLPAPINSAADDFCPTPVRGKGLFFVSRKVVSGLTCGLGDIYFSRLNPAHGWSEPEHLACAPDGPNTSLDEQGPSYFEANGSGQLYFSSSRAAAQGRFVPGDIYMSVEGAGGTFGLASLVSELGGTTAAVTPANDIQPNVRKDGREVVFSSDRSDTLGGQDVYVATRDTTADRWSAPVNLGAAVNSSAGETRPSLSWHGEQLLFGRAGPVGTAEGGTGASDIYVTTREKNGE